MSEQVPEKCPVCGETIIVRYTVNADFRWLELECGAIWREAPDVAVWEGCTNAMPVALELLAAATTPTSAARDALVAAVGKYDAATRAYWENTNRYFDDEFEGKRSVAAEELLNAYAAYLATLAQEPTP